MKALTFHGKKRIKFEVVPDPVIEKPDDAIVKVQLSGICGSDLHIYHEREKGLDHGTTMGHEFVGEIMEIGKNVTSFKPGDMILSPFSTNCAKCFYCKMGLTSRCTESELFGWVEKGVGLQGAQAEYVRVPLSDSTLISMPEDVLPEEGLLLGDVISTGYFCAELAEPDPNGIYVVIGCGPVGLMAIIGLCELGCEIIYAVDSIPDRLEAAKMLGATTINYKTDNPVQVLKDVTDGRGADSVLEAVGNSFAERYALDIVRPGGIISVVGVHTDEHFSFSPMEAYDKNITYKVGRCPARHYMERLIPVLQKKKYDFRSIISHRLSLKDGINGYEIFDRKIENCKKVVLYPFKDPS